MDFRTLMVFASLTWHWRTDAAAASSVCAGNLAELGLVWNVSVVSQLELNQFIENVATHGEKRNTTNCLYLSLAGGNNYELDIVELMKISINGSLIMESKGGPAEINCMSRLSDLEKLRQTLQPLSHALLVLLDGLIFNGCPVPILIEEASNVIIQNCVFQ